MSTRSNLISAAIVLSGLLILGMAAPATLAQPATPNNDTNVSDPGNQTGQEQVTICHVPPDNPDDAHTITIGQPAVNDHLANHPGDTLGPCPADNETESNMTEPNVTEPNVTEPNVTEPNVTEPNVTEPNITEPPANDTEMNDTFDNVTERNDTIVEEDEEAFEPEPLPREIVEEAFNVEEEEQALEEEERAQEERPIRDQHVEEERALEEEEMAEEEEQAVETERNVVRKKYMKKKFAKKQREETVTINVMKHICDPSIQSVEEFDNVDGPDEGNTTEFHDKVLACPTVVMPGDDYNEGTVHFDEKRDFNFEVTGEDGETQDISDARFDQRQVRESDVNVDVNGDGDLNDSLDTSLYVYEGVASGDVTVTETQTPGDTRPGALEFTPQTLQENDDAATLAEEENEVFTDGDRAIELDTTQDSQDNTITLHVYNFQNQNEAEQPGEATQPRKAKKSYAKKGFMKK